MLIASSRVALVRDPADLVAASPPARRAAEHLIQALEQRGLSVEFFDDAALVPPGATCILLAGAESPVARARLASTGIVVPEAPESLALVSTRLAGGAEILLATGRDPRGLVYATLELAERVRTAAADPRAQLRLSSPIVQSPANPIRGVARLFVSEVEDKPWFWDRDFWRSYLSMLATQRFNRIHLAFGIGHDFLRNVLDAYLLFAYPFLVDVPGYDVRVPGLSDAERQRNLDMLRFASDEAAARGLHFQLGVWTQAYAWVDSPNANYVIEGLSGDNHAAYCRDAVRTVLEACPSIVGVTFRVHGESGVPEGNYDFWREVFKGVVGCGRRIELDLHPKGVGQEMIDVALETGLPVALSPKYTAEHMGLPGHQVTIRELERAAGGGGGDAFVEHLMNQSGAALRFTRYGNADFLKEDRRYDVFYRIWPGTQRLLLWGDPVLAAGFGRHASFCGAKGVEVCEPLSFKGRRGSGLAGGRDAYANTDLRAGLTFDFEKYHYTYVLFGRLLYDPDEDPEVWRRTLVQDFGAAAAAVEAALAHASRILPLLTSAHHPSAANNRFWPELYTNMPIVDAAADHPYRDTPEPPRFGTVSALDPGLFASIEEFVRELAEGRPSGRLSPLRVATALDHFASTATRALAEASRTLADADAVGQVDDRADARGEVAHRADAVGRVADRVDSTDFRRVAVDVAIQAALGRFFAAKLRAGVAFEIYRQSGDRDRVGQALEFYRAARLAWLDAVQQGSAYRADITVGGEPWLRGNWADRLGAIDADIADMQGVWDIDPNGGTSIAPPLDELEPPPQALECTHTPRATFEPGAALTVELFARPIDGTDGPPLEATLHYRHVNQAAPYAVQPMRSSGPDASVCFGAEIPGHYTASPYPLQYYFVVRRGPAAQRYPFTDLAADLAEQAYFVVRQVPRTQPAHPVV